MPTIGGQAGHCVSVTEMNFEKRFVTLRAFEQSTILSSAGMLYRYTMTSSKKSQIIAGIALSIIFGFLLLMAYSGHRMDEAEKVTPGAIRSVSAAPRPVKVETYGLTKTGLQLLTNELDESRVSECVSAIDKTNWHPASSYYIFRDRLLDLRIKLAVLNAAKYSSEDQASADVLKFEHELLQLNREFTTSYGEVCFDITRHY